MRKCLFGLGLILSSLPLYFGVQMVSISVESKASTTLFKKIVENSKNSCFTYPVGQGIGPSCCSVIFPPLFPGIVDSSETNAQSSVLTLSTATTPEREVRCFLVDIISDWFE